ncbi:MAG: amino acid adenylation domain-containing protein [Bacteroidetes bacterium]|nr:amino acid adenylation domain-containing protein [Bacteroidota bacterium]
MKEVQSIIKECRDRGIRLSIKDGSLDLSALEAIRDEGLMASIKMHRQGLEDYLVNRRIQRNAMAIPLAGEEPAGYPLSSAQQRLWLLDQLKEDDGVYNTGGAHLFEGKLSLAILELVFEALLRRHESLRTVFRLNEEGKARQVVRDFEDTGFRLGYIDPAEEIEGWNSFAAERKEVKIQALITDEFTRPFDLAGGPLIRVTVYRLAEDKWLLSYVMHHIICDAWSMGILIRELLMLYPAFEAGRENPLTPLRIQYKDYAVWQQEQMTGARMAAHKEWWLAQFGREIPVLALPEDHPRPAVRSYRGGAVVKHFPLSLSTSFKTLYLGRGATPFMALLAAVKTLLYRYTGQQDIVTGSSMASRDHLNIEDQIGFYVNTLALRTVVGDEDTYCDLLEKVRKTTVEAYEHQAYPFDELVNALQVPRDRSRHPLFDVMVVLQNTEKHKAGADRAGMGMSISEYQASPAVVSKFDLTFFFAERADGIDLRLVYNKDIFSERTARTMADHLENLVAAISASPEAPLHSLDYMGGREKDFLLRGVNKASVSYLCETTFLDLYKRQVEKDPEAIAVAAGGRQLSYAQLDERSNRLANYLITQYGVGARDRVGILLDRSEKMIAALLAVMKTGAAYVAIDPDNPKLRREFIIRDTSIKALITQTDYIFDLDYYSGNVFAADIQLEALTTSAEWPIATVDAAAPAYVLYTSGSTGQPKGVVISHRSLVDYLSGLLSVTNISDCRSFGLVSTIAADLGNTVLYSSLITGGRLQIFGTREVMDADCIRQAGVDCLKIVPSHWKVLQDGGPVVAPARCLVLGGEQLTPDIIAQLREGGASCQVYNHYGPSETTIGKLIRRIDIYDPEAVVSLGSPFCNGAVYVVDRRLNLVPIGVHGELCISGEGLSAGYFNRPDLTAEKFVANPFEPGTLLYRTGDLVKWLPDGTISFLGRKDDQVKIRGHRIEPGEIEMALLHCPGIASATVQFVAVEGGEKELIAYTSGKEAANAAELKAILQKMLPSYMLPAWFVHLEEMPLNANGKVDRRRLPDPASVRQASTPYVAPRNAMEEMLVAIWEEVLGRRPIGIRDNFFSLGGHSIKAVQLISRINAALLVKVNLQSIFDEGTVENIAEQISFLRNQQLYDRATLKEIEL